MNDPDFKEVNETIKNEGLEKATEKLKAKAAKEIKGKVVKEKAEKPKSKEARKTEETISGAETQKQLETQPEEIMEAETQQETTQEEAIPGEGAITEQTDIETAELEQAEDKQALEPGTEKELLNRMDEVDKELEKVDVDSNRAKELINEYDNLIQKYENVVTGGEGIETEEIIEPISEEEMPEDLRELEDLKFDKEMDLQSFEKAPKQNKEVINILKDDIEKIDRKINEISPEPGMSFEKSDVEPEGVEPVAKDEVKAETQKEEEPEVDESIIAEIPEANRFRGLTEREQESLGVEKTLQNISSANYEGGTSENKIVFEGEKYVPANFSAELSELEKDIKRAYYGKESREEALQAIEEFGKRKRAFENWKKDFPKGQEKLQRKQAEIAKAEEGDTVTAITKENGEWVTGDYTLSKKNKKTYGLKNKDGEVKNIPKEQITEIKKVKPDTIKKEETEPIVGTEKQQQERQRQEKPEEPVKQEKQQQEEPEKPVKQEKEMAGEKEKQEPIVEKEEDLFKGTEDEDTRTESEKAIDSEKQKRKEEKLEKQKEGDVTKGTPLFDKEEQETRATVQGDVFKQTEEIPENLKPKSMSKPGEAHTEKVKDIEFNPEKFQYKDLEEGVDPSFLNRDFNKELAGTIDVWRDENGILNVINGHHRLKLAKEKNIENINVIEIEAKDAAEARLKGALKNMAEDKGSSIDAAKIFRNSEVPPEQLLEEYGISESDAKVREGLALSNLSDNIFRLVVDEELPVFKATVIGENTNIEEESKQRKAYYASKKFNADELKEYIDDMNQAPEKDAIQGDMFGGLEKEIDVESRIKISTGIRKSLRSTKNNLQKTLKNKGMLEDYGNKVNIETTGKGAESVEQVLNLYDTVKRSSDIVKDIINKYAKKLSKEELKKTDAISEAANEISDKIDQVAEEVGLGHAFNKQKPLATQPEEDMFFTATEIKEASKERLKEMYNSLKDEQDTFYSELYKEYPNQDVEENQRYKTEKTIKEMYDDVKELNNFSDEKISEILSEEKELSQEDENKLKEFIQYIINSFETGRYTDTEYMKSILSPKQTEEGVSSKDLDVDELRFILKSTLSDSEIEKVKTHSIPQKDKKYFDMLNKAELQKKRLEQFEKVVENVGRAQDLEPDTEEGFDFNDPAFDNMLFSLRYNGYGNYSEGDGLKYRVDNNFYKGSKINVPKKYLVLEKSQALESLLYKADTDLEHLNRVVPHYLHNFIDIKLSDKPITGKPEEAGSIGYDREKDKLVITISQDVTAEDLSKTIAHEIGGHLMLSNLYNQDEDMRDEAIGIVKEYKKIYGRDSLSVPIQYEEEIKAEQERVTEYYDEKAGRVAAAEYEANEIMARLMGKYIHDKEQEAKGEKVKDATDSKFQRLYDKFEDVIKRFWESLKNKIKSIIDKMGLAANDASNIEERFNRNLETHLAKAYRKMENAVKEKDAGEFSLFFKWQMNPNSSSEYVKRTAHNKESMQVRNVASRWLSGEEIEFLPRMYDKHDDKNYENIRSRAAKNQSYMLEEDWAEAISEMERTKIISNVSNHEDSVNKLNMELYRLGAKVLSDRSKIKYSKWLIEKKNVRFRDVNVNGRNDPVKFDKKARKTVIEAENKILQLAKEDTLQKQKQQSKEAEKAKKIQDVRAYAKELMEAYNFKPAEKKDVENIILKQINKGKVNTEKQMETLRDKVTGRIEDIRHQKLVQKLRDTIRRVPRNIDPKYEQKIDNWINGITEKGLSAKKRKRLESLKEQIENNFVKKYMIKPQLLRELERLDGKPIKELSSEEIEDMITNINIILEQYDLRNRMRAERMMRTFKEMENKAVYNLRNNMILKESPIDKLPETLSKFFDNILGSGALTRENICKGLDGVDSEDFQSIFGSTIFLGADDALNQKITILDNFTDQAEWYANKTGFKGKELLNVSPVMREGDRKKIGRMIEKDKKIHNKFTLESYYEKKNIFKKSIKVLKKEENLHSKQPNPEDYKNPKPLSNFEENHVPESYNTYDIKLTKAEVMSLYNGSKNVKNMRAIINEGIDIGHLIYGSDNDDNIGRVKLTEKDIANITKTLDNAEKEYADFFFDYLNNENKQLINSVSEIVGNKRLAIEEDYWPMERTRIYKDYLTKGIDIDFDLGSNAFAKSIENNPMFIERNESARGSYVLRDMFEQGFAAVNLGSVYNSYAQYFRLSKQLLASRKIKAELKKKNLMKYHKRLQSYVNGLMSSKLSNDELEGSVKKLLRNTMVSILSQNIFVMGNQIASYPLGLIEMNGWIPKPVLPGEFKKWKNFAIKYSPQLKSRIERGLVNYEVGAKTG
ncbi:MAG TPA: hypothetical protein VKO61_00020, partial [Candidatus Paceibacterota bacterium]|nr:hypothetical protein [Candidatus Paceibacterota bacterium]